MELNAGYKETEVGVIPQDWEPRLLGTEIERLDAGVSVNSLDGSSGDFAHDLSILKTSSVTNGAFLPCECKTIAMRDVHRAKLSPRADTIIISRMNTPDLVGECGYIEKDYPSLFLPDRLWMATVRKAADMHVKWLAYLLSSARYKNKLKSIATGTSGSMKNISKGALLALPIPFPRFAEQRAIAGALSDVDDQIRAMDRLIAKKHDLKQAAMQQLLTGKTRLPGFSGEWEDVTLSQLGRFSKGKGIKRDDVVESGLACIRYGEIYTHYNDYVRECFSHITPGVARESQRLHAGDLLFAGSGETADEIGKCVAFLMDEEVYAGGDIVIFSPLGQDSTFLGYLMNYATIAEQKSRMGQGDAVVHISARSLSSLRFKRPNLPEQKAIASILSDMDAEIAVFEQRRDKTRDLKQGMMQELLTGRSRLI